MSQLTEVLTEYTPRDQIISDRRWLCHKHGLANYYKKDDDDYKEFIEFGCGDFRRHGLEIEQVIKEVSELAKEWHLLIDSLDFVASKEIAECFVKNSSFNPRRQFMKSLNCIAFDSFLYNSDSYIREFLVGKKYGLYEYWIMLLDIAYQGASPEKHKNYLFKIACQTKIIEQFKNEQFPNMGSWWELVALRFEHLKDYIVIPEEKIQAQVVEPPKEIIKKIPRKKPTPAVELSFQDYFIKITFEQLMEALKKGKVCDRNGRLILKKANNSFQLKPMIILIPEILAEYNWFNLDQWNINESRVKTQMLVKAFGITFVESNFSRIAMLEQNEFGQKKIKQFKESIKIALSANIDYL